MKKFILLINLKGNLGGAEIRYISLFEEICLRNHDFYLVINRKLFEFAKKAGFFKQNTDKIIILEIDTYNKPEIKENATKEKGLIKKNKKRKSLIRLFANRAITFAKLCKYTYKLHLVFRKYKPDYVYAVWVGGKIAWPLKYIYKFKFVYSYMDSGFSSLEKFWNRPLKSERMALKHADSIDFLSADLYKGVQQRVKLNKKTKIAITPCSFKNYENIKPADKKDNTVTFCSRMTAIKNPLLLLESIVLFNKMYDKWNNIKFQFLGNGECFQKMEKFVILNELKNIQLLGHIANPVKYLCKSKIFISIQQNNNYPSQSLLEAMACENAIIASDVGETRKLVNKKTGVLVNLNAQEIANAILKLITNEKDIISYGKNARQKVLQEHTIKKYIDYFYSLEK